MRRTDAWILGGLLVYALFPAWSISLSQGGFTVAAIAWALSLRDPAERRRGPLDLALLAYAAAELWSFAFSQSHAQNFVYMKRILLLPMVPVVAGRVRDARWGARLLAALLVGLCAASVWGIAQYAASPGGLEHRIDLRQYVVTTGGLLMMGLLLAAGPLLTLPNGRARALLAAACAAIAPALLFTYTRSAWLGAAAGGGVVLLAARPRWAIPAGALAAAAVFLLPGGFRERLASSFDPRAATNVERTYLWAGGVRVFREHPWTGIGDVDASEAYRRVRDPRAREDTGHFHDNWIHLAATLGLPGLLAVGWITVRSFVLLAAAARRLARARPPPGGNVGAPTSPAAHAWARGVAAGALGAAVGFHVAGLFEWNLGDAEMAMLYWFTLGIGLAAPRWTPPRAP